MNKRTRRNRAPAVVSAFLMLLLVIVHGPGTAEARCVARSTGGAFANTVYIWDVEGFKAGSEEARYSGTCDGDKYYAGRVRNLKGKSTTVYVRLGNSGGYVAMATSRDSAGYRYSFRDSDTSSRVAMTNSRSAGMPTWSNSGY